MIATIGWGLTSVCAASVNVFRGYLKGARRRIVTDGRDCKLPPFLIHSLVDFCCSSEDRNEVETAGGGHYQTGTCVRVCLHLILTNII